MKKTLFTFFAIIFATIQAVYATTETVSPELTTSLKNTANEPNVFSIIFALVFVVCLIYVTGLIYSKLNIVGAKAVKEQLKNYELTKAVVLSTTQLGQGKNLHVIELNNKCYLIGATQNSINLIKELGEITDKTIKPQETNLQAVNAELIQEDATSETPILAEEFDIHKKYL